MTLLRVGLETAVLAFDIAEERLSIGRRVATGAVEVHLRTQLAPIYTKQRRWGRRKVSPARGETK